MIFKEMHRTINFHFKNIKSFDRCMSYSSSDYCINVVRNLDNENYLCTLLLPAHLRRAAMAIRAFNVEVASVQDQVSQPQLGLMRLKFWSESLDKIYNGKVPNHPVAVELSKVVQKFKLSKYLLDNLVTSRIKRFDQPSFHSINEMESYADQSCSSVFLLLMEIASIKSPEALLAGNHVGKAQGLVNLTRGVPHCAQTRTLSLPSDLMARYDIIEESIFRGNISQSLNLVVRDVVERAYFHLSKAREVKKKLSNESKLILLPAVATDRYIKTLHKKQYDVFDGNVQLKDPFLPLKLYLASFLMKY